MPYIGNPIYQSAFVVDQFSGNGSTTAFTMSVAPAGVTNVLVAVSGVLQDPSTYGVVGNTITFSAAPPSGTGNISCRYLGVPASGVTTTAYRTVTEFTATASQTTFTPPSYTVGFINVYRNGSRLGNADYTATNGTTVVLPTGASAGDLVTVESFLVSSVLNAIPNTAGAVTPALLSGNAPQVTVYTSSSGTYTTPSYAKSLYIKMVGGGGGGMCSDSAGGPAAGTTGGTTTFGTSLLTCNGGSGGSYNGTNPGGTATINSPAVGAAIKGSAGASPGIGYNTTLTYLSGGMGGCSPFGGAGQGHWAANPGQPAAVNSGSGGGGAGVAAVAAIPGGGGGSGGYIEAYITSPSATYSYAIGAGGAGAAAGTNGYAGGNGGSGVIIVVAYF
jgi:hypothetical protein